MSTIKKIEQANKLYDKIKEGGGAARIEKQHAQGKMTARERLEYFFDDGTFIELDAFVKHRCNNFGMEKKEITSDGVITGYGNVNGRLVYAFSQDFTVIGGSVGEMNAKKVCKAMDNALKVGAPMVGLNDSAGARIQEGVDALSGYGEIFYRNTLASGVIPQISAIMGPCAGGAVYSPALTDFTFMVDTTSQMFLTGPQVIKNVTGEEVTKEALGGAVVHNSTSGCAQFYTANDQECIDQIKRLLSFLPSNNLDEVPSLEMQDDVNRMIYELNSIIPDSSNAAYNMLDVIYALSDNNDFMEYQPMFAKNMVCGFMRLNGQSVGVVANQPNHLAGCLDINASDKSSRFIRTCDAFNIPILTLVDVPGFLPGVSQEYGGIIRHGAKMLYAYSEATVPLVTVILRKAYGGSELAMGAKQLGADLVMAWPTAEIAVTGPQGAASIIFRKDIANAADDQKDQVRQEKIDEYTREFATPYIAAERGYVDAIIEPASTRQRIIDGFNMLSTKRETLPAKKHGNIPL
jgi:acetyl-CoA carboxylase carboxyltransferase component